MAKKRVFISFDYDNDSDIKVLLAGQAKYQDSPFDFNDASVKEHMTGDWKEKVRNRLKNCDQVIVLCGRNTNKAQGVAIELEITRELGMPYFHLKGRKDYTCYKPTSARDSDKIYNWTWDNLKALIGGSR